MLDNTLGLSLVIGAALGAGFNKTFRSAQDRLNDLGKTADKLSLGKQLSGEIVKLETKLGDLKRKQAAAGGGANALAQDIGKVEGALNAATKKAHAHGLEIGDAKEAYKRFGTQLDKTQGKIGRIQRAQAAKAKLQGMRGRALGLLGAAYGASRITGKAMDLEEQRIHLRSVITPVAGGKDEALERAAAHARAAARTSLASESELLELQYQLSSGGLDEEAARLGSVIAANVGKTAGGGRDRDAYRLGSRRVARTRRRRTACLARRVDRAAQPSGLESRRRALDFSARSSHSLTRSNHSSVRFVRSAQRSVERSVPRSMRSAQRSTGRSMRSAQRSMNGASGVRIMFNAHRTGIANNSSTSARIIPARIQETTVSSTSAMSRSITGRRRAL